MKDIKIIIKNREIQAQLNDSKTAEAIWERLSIESKVNTWGQEIYFEIPIKMGPENAVEVVNLGDLAYWPQGHCFCIFFGMTPVSSKGKIKPASKVNLIGKVKAGLEVLKTFRDGDKITIIK